MSLVDQICEKVHKTKCDIYNRERVWPADSTKRIRVYVNAESYADMLAGCKDTAVNELERLGTLMGCKVFIARSPWMCKHHEPFVVTVCQ